MDSGSQAAARPPVKFRYAKPAAQDTDKAIVGLGQSDIIRGAVQVVRKGGDNNLHAHTGMDGFWMVLKGRVRFYGPGNEVQGEFGPHEGVITPRNTPYWFECVGEEVLEILQVVAFDRSVKNRRVDLEPQKFEVGAQQRFDARVDG